MLRTRLFAWHRELQDVHHRLEKALKDARKAIRRGERAQALKPELRIFCYTFCSALGSHHRSEDDHFFPALLRQAPELAPAIARLRREHEVLARLLARLPARARRSAHLTAAALPADQRGQGHDEGPLRLRGRLAHPGAARLRRPGERRPVHVRRRLTGRAHDPWKPSCGRLTVRQARCNARRSSRWRRSTPSSRSTRWMRAATVLRCTPSTAAVSAIDDSASR